MTTVATLKTTEALYDRACTMDADAAITALASVREALDSTNLTAEAKELVTHDLDQAARHIEQNTSIDGALCVLAAYFYDPVQGYRGEFNALAFQQRGVLGNMLQNTMFQLERAQDYLATETRKLNVLVEQSKGDELSMQGINAQIDRVERIKDVQIPHLKDWGATLKRVYKVAVGEDWKPMARTGTKPAVQTRDATQERLAKLGLNAKIAEPVEPYEPRTNGTEAPAA